MFRALLEELLALIKEAMPLDGVLLVLHGAMMADDAPDATGEVLARVRELDFAACQRLAQQALMLPGAHEVRACVGEHC